MKISVAFPTAMDSPDNIVLAEELGSSGPGCTTRPRTALTSG